MLLHVDGLRHASDRITLDAATVTCAECGKTIDEDEAQAARWGYWSNGMGERYPFCLVCADREFGHGRGSATLA